MDGSEEFRQALGLLPLYLILLDKAMHRWIMRDCPTLINQRLFDKVVITISSRHLSNPYPSSALIGSVYSISNAFATA